MLDVVVRQKTGMLKGKTVDASTFTEDELKLVMVTRSLAGAVKAVIDVPILTSDGDINPDAKVKYENTMKELPAFRSAVNEVEHIDYTQKARVTTVKHSSECKNNSTSSLRNCLIVVSRTFFLEFPRLIRDRSVLPFALCKDALALSYLLLASSAIF